MKEKTVYAGVLLIVCPIRETVGLVVTTPWMGLMATMGSQDLMVTRERKERKGQWGSKE